MSSDNIINDPEKLRDIMSESLEKAGRSRDNKSVYRASIKLSRNLTVEANIRNFSFTIDEPPEIGGDDKGPNPEEVVLAGVGACQAITAALYAAYYGIPIKKYEMNLKGYADLSGFFGMAQEGQPKGFNRVKSEITIESDAPEKELKKLEKIAAERCVGHGTLEYPVQIEQEWSINGKKYSSLNQNSE